MDKIIKLYGKIIGTPSGGSDRVKIRLLCTEYAVKRCEDPDFDEFEYCQKDVRFSYEGPAHLSGDDLRSLCLSDTVPQTTYGVGELIENLFGDEMVEVYIGYRGNAEKVIIEHVVVARYEGKAPQEITDFIMMYA